jgi:hypothetical protein
MAPLSQALAADPVQPPVPQTTAAQPAPAADPAPATGTPHSDAAAPPTAASDADVAAQKEAADEAKRLRGMGWKPRVQNGVTVYCKKEDVIGSRFPTENCGSARDIEARMQDSQQAVSKIQRQFTTVPHTK